MRRNPSRLPAEVVLERTGPRVSKAGVGGGWVEAGLVGEAGSDGVGEVVVDLEDEALGAVLAVGLFVVPSDDGEGLHHVIGVVA